MLLLSFQLFVFLPKPRDFIDVHFDLVVELIDDFLGLALYFQQVLSGLLQRVDLLLAGR